MNIVGMDGLSALQLNDELKRGARFVIYQYCISVVLMSYKRSSSIHFVPAGGNRLLKGLPFVGLSLVLGWWGIPWGPIWTIGTVVKNLGGGVDVTSEVVAALTQAPPSAVVQAPTSYGQP